MITKHHYDQYRHTIQNIYRARGVDHSVIETAFADWRTLAGLSQSELVTALSEQSRFRLGLLGAGLCSELISTPQIRELKHSHGTIKIPLLNKQGIEWYASSPLENFDFIHEQDHGLLDGAKTIYDLGGHHGVWAAFYSQIVGPSGVVFSFEPSIINIEIAATLMLINAIENVTVIGAAVGNDTSFQQKGNPASSGMLVDYVDDDIDVLDVRSIFWRRGDFVKIDIEGFEYDILTHNPWIFDAATHMHLELHIPHLKRRNLDYRDVTRLIPFDKFHVENHVGGISQRVTANTELEGYCSLMMRRIA